MPYTMQVLEHKEPEEQLLWCSKCKVVTSPQSSDADSSCHNRPCTRCCMERMSLMRIAVVVTDLAPAAAQKE